jgi:hypothetical protein
VTRYLPHQTFERNGFKMTKAEEKELNEVGTKCKGAKAAINLQLLFGKMSDDNSDDDAVAFSASGIVRRKDTKQKVKSSKLIFKTPTKAQDSVAAALAKIDDSLLSDEDDEFDSMIASKGLSEKLGLSSDSELLLKSSQTEKIHFNDGLSDDEEYQKMTEEERNEKMKPKLNVDGAVELSSDDDNEPSSTTGERSKVKRRMSSSEEEELPDLDCSIDSNNLPLENGKGQETPPRNSADYQKVPELTPNQKKNLIVPPREPAVCGKRRRPTLIITPASLISHWIQQIQEHVDQR